MNLFFQFVIDHIRNLIENVKLTLQVTFNKKYIKSGKCNCCGSCCQNISIKHGKNIIKTEEQFYVLQSKFKVYNMFEIMDNTEQGLVFICKNLNKETGKCRSYKKRPPICRNYPNEIIFRLGGNLANNCGYAFKPIKTFEKVYTEVSKKQ